jgi:putative membrane protein
MKTPIYYAIVAAAAVALTACGGGNKPSTAGNTGGQGSNQPTASNMPPGSQGTTGTAQTGGNQGQQNTGQQSSGTAERSSNLSGAERQFLTNTAESTMAGLQMAQMASSRASSASVRSLAQQLAGTYQSRLSELQRIASSNGVSLPSSVNNADRARMDSLGNASGPQFDQAYLSAMVSDGQRDATAFALEAANGSDQGLKKFASDALPKMQATQQYAKGMLAQLQSGNAGANANANQGMNPNQGMNYPNQGSTPNYNPPPQPPPQ